MLQVQAGSSELRDLTIRDGVLASVGAGIWISDEPARLTVRDSVITNNIAQGENGGGIWNIGSLVLVCTTVSDNRTLFSGRGGGIYNDDEADLLRLVESTVSGNSADSASGPEPAFGGGIFNDGGFPISGPVELLRTTLSGNRATGSAGDLGGGIYSEGALTLISSTVVANSAPGGANLFRAAPSTLGSTNTILADPAGGAGCGAEATAAAPVSGGFNLDEDGSCGLAVAPGDLVGVDPLLVPLAANGGPTMTHAEREGSPAIDAGRAAPGEATPARVAATGRRSRNSEPGR